MATASTVYYTANASANWTLNVRFSANTALNAALAVGQTVSLTFLASQGGTAYLGNTFQIDGTTVTPVWPGGAPTAGGASGIDVYSYTIIKTAASTYKVLASMTSFK